MTRRERLERRLEKRQEWAESRKRKSEAAFEKAQKIGSYIPMGQPVLIGHHSERHHRRDLDRIDNAMRQSVESSKMSDLHEQKADGLQAQLDRSIFSDDPDAVEALEARAAALDAEADLENAINKAWRKHKGGDGFDAALIALGVSVERISAHRRTMTLSPYLRGPCFTTNTRANARRLRERIKHVQARQSRQAQAEQAGGVLIARRADSNWCTITFSERPEREIINALKEARYGWGGGSWSGYLDKLPAIVAELQPA